MSAYQAFVEFDIEEVMRYFLAGITPKADGDIIDKRWYYDQRKGIVIVALLIERRELDAQGNEQ